MHSFIMCGYSSIAAHISLILASVYWPIMVFTLHTVLPPHHRVICTNQIMKITLLEISGEFYLLLFILKKYNTWHCISCCYCVVFVGGLWMFLLWSSPLRRILQPPSAYATKYKQKNFTLWSWGWITVSNTHNIVHACYYIGHSLLMQLKIDRAILGWKRSLNNKFNCFSYTRTWVCFLYWLNSSCSDAFSCRASHNCWLSTLISSSCDWTYQQR